MPFLKVFAQSLGTYDTNKKFMTLKSMSVSNFFIQNSSTYDTKLYSQ